MGQLLSRDKPLESPLDETIPEAAGQVGKTVECEGRQPKSFDPRSVSDDVSRTPIQLQDNDDDEPTPGSGTKLLLSDSGVDEVKATSDSPSSAFLQKKMKSLSLDPRSPSGIPRTPIVVEEENSTKTEDNPKRGAVAANLPATKLEFEEKAESGKATLVQDEEVQVLMEEKASENEVDVDEENKRDMMTEKSLLESSLEEGEIRSGSEDEEENEEPELNLRPQRPFISSVKTTVPLETGSKVSPNRVPLGEVENKDSSLVI